MSTTTPEAPTAPIDPGSVPLPPPVRNPLPGDDVGPLDPLTPPTRQAMYSSMVNSRIVTELGEARMAVLHLTSDLGMTQQELAQAHARISELEAAKK